MIVIAIACPIAKLSHRKPKFMRKFILPAALLALVAASPAAAQVKRIGAATSPILQAAVVPAGTDIMYVSGITPPAMNAGAPAGTPPEFGDTKTQTNSDIARTRCDRIIDKIGKGSRGGIAETAKGLEHRTGMGGSISNSHQ